MSTLYDFAALDIRGRLLKLATSNAGGGYIIRFAHILQVSNDQKKHQPQPRKTAWPNTISRPKNALR